MYQAFVAVLRDLPDGTGRRRRDQGRTERRRAPAPPRCGGRCIASVRDAQCEQEVGLARPEEPARTRPADRDGQARRRAGGELCARRHRAPRHWRRGNAQDQSEARLCTKLRLRARRSLPRLSGDGPHRAGDVRRHGHHGIPGPGAGKGRPGAVRLLRGRTSLRRHRHGAVRPRAHRARAHGRGRDARRGLRLALVYARHVLRARLAGGRPHRQPPRRLGRVTVQCLPDQRRISGDHLRR